MSEIFGSNDGPDFSEPQNILIIPEELIPLLDWAFGTDEGGAARWPEVYEKAQEMGLEEFLAKWGWANAAGDFLAAAKLVQDDLDEDARKSEWEV